jgi:hypothetical protein
MRGRSFSGYIIEGDEVEIYQPNWREGQTVYPDQVRNISYGALVQLLP